MFFKNSFIRHKLINYLPGFDENKCVFAVLCLISEQTNSHSHIYKLELRTAFRKRDVGTRA